MRWTSRPPTEPGFYYFRHPQCDACHVWVAQVQNTRSAGLFAEIFSNIDRDRISHRSVESIVGEWAGPLPKPPLPKRKE